MHLVHGEHREDDAVATNLRYPDVEWANLAVDLSDWLSVRGPGFMGIGVGGGILCGLGPYMARHHGLYAPSAGLGASASLPLPLCSLLHIERAPLCVVARVVCACFAS